jgi:hypothetical protein
MKQGSVRFTTRRTARNVGSEHRALAARTVPQNENKTLQSLGFRINAEAIWGVLWSWN